MALYLALGAHIGLVLAIAVYFSQPGFLSQSSSRRKGSGQAKLMMPLYFISGWSWASIDFGDFRHAPFGDHCLGLPHHHGHCSRRSNNPRTRASAAISRRLNHTDNAPAVATLGIIFGFWRHGPTSAIGSATYGDTIYYVARFEALVATGRLDQNLMVEGSNYIFQSISRAGAGTGCISLPVNAPIRSIYVFCVNNAICNVVLDRALLRCFMPFPAVPWLHFAGCSCGCMRGHPGALRRMGNRIAWGRVVFGHDFSRRLADH